MFPLFAITLVFNNHFPGVVPHTDRNADSTKIQVNVTAICNGNRDAKSACGVASIAGENNEMRINDQML